MTIQVDRTVESIMKGLQVEALAGQRAIIVAAPDDSLKQAAEWFTHFRVHHLPIVNSVEDRKLVGILSTLDVVRYCSQNPGTNIDTVKISTVMVASPETIAPHTTLRAAIELFASAHYQSLPVVDAEGHCVGIVTLRDVVATVAKDLSS